MLSRRTTGLREWIEAELRCLLCGRLLGWLTEPLSGRSHFVGFSSGALFRSLVRGEAPRPMRSDEWLRCQACGGTAMAGQPQRFTRYEEGDARCAGDSTVTCVEQAAEARSSADVLESPRLC
jgi:hypothetical protein